MEVAGIAVPAALLRSWAGWLAPQRQPFFVARGELRGIGGAREETLELTDTFWLWRDQRPRVAVWLDEPAFLALPRALRASLVRSQVAARRGAVFGARAWSDLLDPAALRAQADGHRFVLWPSLIRGVEDEVVRRFVTADVAVSRHREVPARVWRAAVAVLPGARALAGTFVGHGPNCFGTVMAAAGSGEGGWTGLEQWERWLATRTRPGGDDAAPGTVLLWREAGGGRAQHAAVTLGDGWALEKRGQEWHNPRAVLPVREVIRSARTAGWHLERHQLVAGLTPPRGRRASRTAG